MSALIKPSVILTPDALLESHIAASAARTEPIPVDSPEGQQLYRALGQHIWTRQLRPVCANDVRDLWERIDSIKRGSPVNYGIIEIHFWAADYANALATDSVAVDSETNKRLAAWLNEWPNVCILGQTGRGKSSTINRLFGIKMAEISHHSACTSTVSDYRLVTGTFLNRPTGIILWDVPGYGDERISWDRYVKLYRRMARRCDVVVFMLDNDRSMRLDLKMFKKLRKIADLESKLVVALNKADLFHPCNWDESANAPGDGMQATIQQRVSLVAEHLELRSTERVVPVSALRNWNTYGLLTAMVDAAGSSKGATLLRAAHPTITITESEGASLSPEDAELARRFGINTRLRHQFRSLISH